MATLSFSSRLRQMLGALVKSCATPQVVAQRALIFLDLERTQSISATAKRLDVKRKTVWKWRTRCLEHLSELEGLAGRKLAKRLLVLLADAPRPGHPPTFNAVQMAGVIAMACEAPPPELAISHWTTRALAEEAVRRGLVPAISRQTVWRFLKSERSPAAPREAVAQSA